MILICAVDENWNIGYKGKMLAEINTDLKRFQKLTEGHIVIMGKNTYDAIPREDPLPNRTNIVLTENIHLEDKGFIVAKSMIDLLEILNEINQDDSKKVFVIGGSSVVEQLYPRVKEAYITKILKEFDHADRSIINLDEQENWYVVSESEVFKEKDLEFKYVDYVRKVV